MIPKIIHYCWYGHGEKDDLIKRCIVSWRKYCPDYEIIEWNEDNSDFSDNAFACEAYQARKWAFVSDYWRLKVLYKYGGIYVDTDVEILKNIDQFLMNGAFLGYANDTYIGSGMLGCVPKNQICKILLSYYENRHFKKNDGTYNDIPNNQIYTAICYRELGLKFGDNFIETGNTRVYPSDYFSPFKLRTIGNEKRIYCKRNFECTKNTYAIHYTVCSWGKNISTTLMLILNQIIRLALPRTVYFFIKRKTKMNQLMTIEL